MRPFSRCAEAHFILEPFNAKSGRIILVHISCIFFDKHPVSLIIDSSTGFIREVELFYVIDEDVSGDVLDSCDITTVILTDSRVEALSCSMCYNFCPMASSFTIGPDFVVIALNPELEVSFPTYHCVINFFVIIESLNICEISLYVTAAASSNQICKIRYNYHSNRPSETNKRVHSCTSDT